MKTHFEKHALLKKIGFFILGGEQLVHERLDRINRSEQDKKKNLVNTVNTV